MVCVACVSPNKPLAATNEPRQKIDRNRVAPFPSNNQSQADRNKLAAFPKPRRAGVKYSTKRRDLSGSMTFDLGRSTSNLELREYGVPRGKFCRGFITPCLSTIPGSM